MNRMKKKLIREIRIERKYDKEKDDALKVEKKPSQVLKKSGAMKKRMKQLVREIKIEKKKMNEETPSSRSSSEA